MRLRFAILILAVVILMVASIRVMDYKINETNKDCKSTSTEQSNSKYFVDEWYVADGYNTWEWDGKQFRPIEVPKVGLGAWMGK